MAGCVGRSPRRYLRAQAAGLAVAFLAWTGSEAQGQRPPGRIASVDSKYARPRATSATPPPGLRGLAPGRYAFFLATSHGPRKYVVHVPSSFDPARPLPVVVALHGAGGSADTFLDESNWAAQAERSGFLAVAPEGLPLQPNLPSNMLANPRVWNSGQYGGNRARSQIDDVAFVTAVLDDLPNRCWVNRGRVYAVGYSNGGAMVFRLAAERAERFTAIASVSGFCWIPEPAPRRALPTLVIFGTMDPIVPLRGGLKILPWEIQPSPPIASVMSRWAIAIGCPAAPHPAGWSPAPGVRVEDYGPGVSGNILRVMYTQFQGHSWPGSRSVRPERLLGPDLSQLDATAQIAQFFDQWAW